ncbi:hypothetical protein Esti_006823 [Eimeria stiedai]
MSRLTLSSQASQQPSLRPECPSSASSASLYNASLRVVKYPTYDGSRGQDKVTDFLNVFAIVKSLNNSDNDLPHCRAALTRLQQLRSSDDLPLDEVQEACFQEDEAEFSRASFSTPGSISREQHQTQQAPTNFQGACPICGDAYMWKDCSKKKRSGGPAAHVQASPRVDKLAALPGPSISAQVIKTNSLINSPKQLVFEGTVNKQPINFLLDGGADHSIMSKNFAVTSGITMHPLDPLISTTFANNSSEVIRFATEPLQLQCQGHRSLVQPLVSTNVSFDLLVGLDWLAQNNPRVDWDNGSLLLSGSVHCYKWEAV